MSSRSPSDDRLTTQDTAGDLPRRLFVFNGGFFRAPRLRRILTLAGWRPVLGLPGPGDAVGIWGGGGTAWRGRAIAERHRADLVTVEDAFLRSILPGRAYGPVARRGPIGMLIDPDGAHYDPSRPSRLETLVAAAGDLETRARDGIARLRAADLSKYNAHLPEHAPPRPGYVLVIDQTRGDASLMGAGRARFLQMLACARDENPGARIVVRSHPETSAGLRQGHLGPGDLFPGEVICDTQVSPWRLVEGADRVYAVSSQLGYEAMLAGHRPRLFGQPFYAGWGLSDDEATLSRRHPVPVERLFAASHLLAPVWYDPCRDRLCDFETALDQIEAEARAWRQDHAGHRAHGLRLWKRAHLARFFGSGKGLRVTADPAQATMVWGAGPAPLRIEDGFLRSRGLGAELIPPLSLAVDDLGIYYDPTRESRLERLIATPADQAARARAANLLDRLTTLGLSKYNHGAPVALPRTDRPRILVPGQVEDDASIRLGAGAERTNRALLERARAEFPDAYLIYKPHPDVLAGLRPGACDATGLADLVLTDSDPAALLDQVQGVVTITSTLGFEALLRGVPVTTLGAPFYAGWGLTRDLGAVPARRRARPDLTQLVWAALIAYPRYFDPKSGLPCPPEVTLDRLADPARPPRRLLVKAQGALASYAWIWR